MLDRNWTAILVCSSFVVAFIGSITAVAYYGIALLLGW